MPNPNCARDENAHGAVNAGAVPIDVSVVFPCLNEERAIGECVDQAIEVLARAGLVGEVLVVDNDSSDRSAEIAAAHGARVARERRRGYGSAYQRGFAEARGRFIVMLDADGTYPVELVPEFVCLMRDEGADMVVGNRFGGAMERDAMPFLNRYLGNPVLSGTTRLLYRLSLKDIHCGMRGIRREVLPALGLQTPGMEFATEMIVKAADQDLRIREIDIPYRPRMGESKLNPIRDAWRHLEYMLVFSPVSLFLGPGLLLFLAGLAVQLILFSGPRAVFFRTWDIHTNLAGLAASLIGATLLVLGLVSCAVASSVNMRFRHSPIARWVARIRGQRIRALGIITAVFGAGLWLSTISQWMLSGAGALDAIPRLSLATTLLASGLELLGATFIVHVIGLKR